MTFAKTAAVILALADVAITLYAHSPACEDGGIAAALMRTSLLFVILGLGSLFGAETLGGFIGSVGRGGFVDSPTPDSMFVFLGWLLLLLPVAAFLFHFFFQPAAS